eukprot:Sspe_Gene.111765::Locus_93891_Transcript_1_1_Confidence_1.000_Length_1578::g.111765::m.111765
MTEKANVRCLPGSTTALRRQVMIYSSTLRFERTALRPWWFSRSAKAVMTGRRSRRWSSRSRCFRICPSMSFMHSASATSSMARVVLMSRRASCGTCDTYRRPIRSGITSISSGRDPKRSVRSTPLLELSFQRFPSPPRRLLRTAELRISSWRLTCMERSPITRLTSAGKGSGKACTSCGVVGDGEDPACACVGGAGVLGGSSAVLARLAVSSKPSEGRTTPLLSVTCSRTIHESSGKASRSAGVVMVKGRQADEMVQVTLVTTEGWTPTLAAASMTKLCRSGHSGLKTNKKACSPSTVTPMCRVLLDVLDTDFSPQNGSSFTSIDPSVVLGMPPFP